MNPDQILAMLAQQTGNAFSGAWNVANQTALPVLRGLANITARPLGFGVGSAMGLKPEQMDNRFYDDISRGLISDQSPIADFSSLLLPDVQGAAQGDPFAVAGLVPFVGRGVRPVRTIAEGVKKGQQATKIAKAAVKSSKPAAKGVNPAKSKLGRAAQHVDRNAGKYYGGTIAADLVNEMYGGR